MLGRPAFGRRLPGALGHDVGERAGAEGRFGGAEFGDAGKQPIAVAIEGRAVGADALDAAQGLGGRVGEGGAGLSHESSPLLSPFAELE